MPMSQKEYINACGSICPFCKSDDIKAEGLEPMGGIDAVDYISCNKCNKEWKDHYRLYEYEEIT